MHMPDRPIETIEALLNREIGRRIAAARTAKGMTQMVLAKAIGRDRTLVGRIEAGKVGVTPYLLKELSQQLDVHIMQFLVESDLPYSEEFAIPNTPNNPAPNLDLWIERVLGSGTS
jgi:ribosome-binding protein aMBF1 (putative translation factor)